jgi:hypothetical protein
MRDEKWNGIGWYGGCGLQTQPEGVNHLAGIEVGLGGYQR